MSTPALSVSPLNPQPTPVPTKSSNLGSILLVAIGAIAFAAAAYAKHAAWTVPVLALNATFALSVVLIILGIVTSCVSGSSASTTVDVESNDSAAATATATRATGTHARSTSDKSDLPDVDSTLPSAAGGTSADASPAPAPAQTAAHTAHTAGGGRSHRRESAPQAAPQGTAPQAAQV